MDMLEKGAAASTVYITVGVTAPYLMQKYAPCIKEIPMLRE